MDNVEQALHRLLRTVQTAGSARERALAAQRVVTEIGSGGGLRKAVSAARMTAVNELRGQGRSLAEIAELLGISRGTAQQISEGRATGRVVLPRR